MESEEAYKHPKDCGNPYCEMCNYNRGYAEGLKAERERCADICEQNATCEGIAQKIKAHILGVHDGE